jgi:hypothetical protein
LGFQDNLKQMLLLSVSLEKKPKKFLLSLRPAVSLDILPCGQPHATNVSISSLSSSFSFGVLSSKSETHDFAERVSGKKT